MKHGQYVIILNRAKKRTHDMQAYFEWLTEHVGFLNPELAPIEVELSFLMRNIATIAYSTGYFATVHDTV
jgi:hypothetical protein